MTKFLLKLCLFLGIFMAVVGAAVAVSVVLIKDVSFTLPSKKHILVLGDSHTECAINDTILEQYCNASQSANPFLYSYLKLDKFISANPQIDTVLLSYRPAVLLKTEWLEAPQNLFEYIPRYFAFMSFEDCKEFSHIPSFYLAALNVPQYGLNVAWNLFSRKKCTWSEIGIGHFKHLVRNKLNAATPRQDDEATLAIKSSKKNPPPAVESPGQVRYLKKIITYCRDHKVTLILLRTPTYHQVPSGPDDPRFDAPTIDMSKFPLADTCYGDRTHLNYHGATIYSKYIRDHGIQFIQ